jgi:hypothetical protein
MSSVISPSLASALPQSTSGSNPLFECGLFALGFTWGTVKTADIRMASELAPSVPIQIIGGSVPATPSGCSSGGGTPIMTVADLGANGLVGIGAFTADLGLYYTCPTSPCAQVTVLEANQVQNPVTSFAVNNNGTIISLPSVPSNGSVRASGTLTFGIGTQANNGLGVARKQNLDTNGNFTTTISGSPYASSFLDSGSNALFFDETFDASIVTCVPTMNAPSLNDFYCPPAIKNLTASNQAATGPAILVNFQVAIATTLFSNTSMFAFSNLAGPAGFGGVFDWGVPFFYGRDVYTAIEGQPTPAGAGPYVAY